MAAELSSLTEALIAAAKRAGADAADAVAVDGSSLSIGTRAGALEQAERAEGIDIGLRVLIGQRQACVSSSDVSPGTLTTMAERAVAMAREAPEDPSVGLADQAQLARSWDLEALDLWDGDPEPDPAHLQAMAEEAEAVARDTPGITQVEAASAGHGRRRIHLSASNGFSGGYRRSDTGLSCVAITGTGTGMERDYYGDMRLHRADMISAAEIGRLAAERTLARANPRQPVTGSYPVLFDERISSSLIGHLLSAINGAAIARGSSWLRDAMGTPVLPDGIDLIEDPHRARIPGSRPFDGEGLPTAQRSIVENGVLTGWVLDLATGRKLGLPSTANAQRGTSSPPSPGAGNLAMTQGTISPEQLMRDMGTGLLVTSMIGSTINPNTGDYSRGASGMWIENGVPAYPVNECTIAGNLRDMLRGLIPSNDARPHLSRVIPSLLVDGMTLAGA